MKYYKEKPEVVKEEPQKKKKISSLTIFVVFSIAALIIYTIIDKVIFVKLGISDATLTTCFFGFFGGEVVTCALIKIFKIKNE